MGGSVRDLLLKRKTHGWDFTTNATPAHILALFPDSFYDNQFGTVGIKIKASSVKDKALSEETIDVYEVTTYRSESGYRDHRHPDEVVWGTTLEEDLSRRDLTINAIAFDGEKIIDPYQGEPDLKNKSVIPRPVSRKMPYDYCAPSALPPNSDLRLNPRLFLLSNNILS